MIRTTNNPWLHRFVCLVALATLFLVALGGVVTTKGVGMAVPDWPNTYGENMFLFPPSKWVGGIFYEHTHRLVASAVGLLTTILAVWLWRKEERRWLRRLGVIAFIGVVVQGLLGGMRVVFDTHGWGMEFGVLHATLAQLFLVLICALALFTSRWWVQPERPVAAASALFKLRKLFLLATGLILAQLIIGALMRHQHAGLAIPDFPLAYEKLWPAIDAASVKFYNQKRLEVGGENPITASQIVLQMMHRAMAVLIFFAVLVSAWKALRLAGAKTLPGKLGGVWLALLFAQICLGAATIWSNRKVDVTTAHVAVGALSLVTGAVLVLIVSRYLALAAVTTAGKSANLPAGQVSVAQ